MHPFLEIGNIKIPLYSTIFITAFCGAVAIAMKMSKKYGVAKEDILYGSVFGAIGLFAGAKVMFFISKLPVIIKNFDDYIRLFKINPIAAVNFSFGGLVFYGGLIGMVSGIYIYCRKYKVSFTAVMDTYTPLIPMVHGVGRIGCFFAGCCYGREYHGMGSVNFPYNELVPELDDVPRVPVQLIEAGLNFIMFFILVYLAKKKRFRDCRLLGIYILYYTVVRIPLEMFRGDVIRGNVAGISTSQIISIILFPIGIILVSGKYVTGKAADKR